MYSFKKVEVYGDNRSILLRLEGEVYVDNRSILLRLEGEVY